MHYKVISSVKELRNWVDNATSDWVNREPVDVDKLTLAIQSEDHHPLWGHDWSDYLERLDLEAMVS